LNSTNSFFFGSSCSLFLLSLLLLGVQLGSEGSDHGISFSLLDAVLCIDALLDSLLELCACRLHSAQSLLLHDLLGMSSSVNFQELLDFLFVESLVFLLLLIELSSKKGLLGHTSGSFEMIHSSSCSLELLLSFSFGSLQKLSANCSIRNARVSNLLLNAPIWGKKKKKKSITKLF